MSRNAVNAASGPDAGTGMIDDGEPVGNGVGRLRVGIPAPVGRRDEGVAAASSRVGVARSRAVASRRATGTDAIPP
jgi:hypothetical protein